MAHALALRDPERRTDRWLARVVLSALLSMGVMVFSLSLYGVYLDPAAGAGHGQAAEALEAVFRMGALALTLPIFFLIGFPLADAVLSGRRWLSADALVVVSTSAALLASVWNTLRSGGEVWYETAALVLTLFGLGRWLETRARERASASLRELVPQVVRPAVRLEQGVEREVEPAALRPGDRVRLVAGDVAPVDGTVERGRAFVDTSSLTGEAVARSTGPGDEVLAGTRLEDGALVVCVRRPVGERLQDEVERALARALASRPASVRLADRVASVLLPLAFGIAALTAAAHWSSRGPAEAALNALAVVLIACPCALGIATPLAFWAAIEAVWRRGVLVRDGEVLEALARVRAVLFDKTGTLTEGALRLERIVPLSPDVSERELLRVAASLERASHHPIARAVVAAARERGLWAELSEPEAVNALAGQGLEGQLEGVRWRLSRAETGASEATTAVLARAGRPCGALELRAVPRPEARAVLEQLRARGLELAVLTGDGAGPARELERALGIPVESELTPLGKLERLRARGAAAAFVGDGLNDAPALAAAGVGISMSSAAAGTLAAADVNLLRDGLEELPLLVDAARTALGTARVNLAWALGYNGIGVLLAATGRLTPVLAGAAMVLSSAAVVVRTQRTARRLAAQGGAPSPRGRAGRAGARSVLPGAAMPEPGGAG